MSSRTYIFSAYESKKVRSKNGNVFSQGPIRLGVFCHIFSACLSAFNFDIHKDNRRSHVKLYNILFFKKEKMK